ncbi:hypothetical protein BDQ17DRAFT_1429254 [Cyathus striatus]|nr:hypothetical protein BDQ17DRAFT_1429254 [Cyathus striatus]
MVRRSSRIKQAVISAEASDSDADEVSKKPPAPRRKKQKTAATASGSTKMPLDILLEIFGNLEPLDLLHVGRTTKAVRAIVFSRSATGLWNRVFDAYEDLPRVPMTWQGQPTPVSCSRDFVTYVDDKVLEAEGLQEVRALVPSILLTGRRRQECRRVYHHETAVSISKAISKMSKKEKETWVEARKELIDDRDTEGDECMMWLIERAQERSIEGEQIRIRRRDTIVQRLKDLGWADEIERMPDPTELTGHPLVWQRKDLTDRIWNNIRPQLIQFMEEKKAERLEWQESAMLHLRRPLLRILRKQYAKTLPPNSIVPPEADLNDYEPFRNIIEETPPDQEVTIDDFNDVLDGLPEFVSQWRGEKDRELLRIMGAPVTENPDFSPLKLATTVFHCAKSYSFRSSPCCYVSYPQILVHKCARSYGTRRLYPSEISAPMGYDDELYIDLGEAKWNSEGQVLFSTQGHQIAEKIVSLCELDPKSATCEDMDARDPVFQCNLCTRDGARCCMRWREAIYHSLSEHHLSDLSLVFTLIEDNDVVKDVKFLLEQARLSWMRAGEESVRWKLGQPAYRLVCVHCTEKYSFHLMNKHLDMKHGIAKATHDDVVVDMDIEPRITCTYQYDELL